MLPPTSQVKDILAFLNKILEDKMAQRRKRQIFKSLLHSEHLQVSCIGIVVVLIGDIYIYSQHSGIRGKFWEFF